MGATYRAKGVEPGVDASGAMFSYTYSEGKISKQPFAGKKPVALIVEDGEIALDGVWRNLVVGTVEHLFGKYGEKLVEGVGRAGTAVFAMVKEGMREPWLHEASGIWLEMNMSAQRCVSASRALFGICGADLGCVRLVYGEDGNESPSRKSVTIVEEPDDGEIEALEADLRTNYKNGFDFSATSMRLVEGRTGIAFNDGIVRCLQRRMFERRDGIWFFEDQIADSELTNEIVWKCEHWLNVSPIATMSQFVRIAELRTMNLHDELDIGKFAERAILHSPFGAGCDFHGKRGGRICFIADVGADASKKAFAEKVEDVLRERCDAVGIIELADLFPMVSADWMKTNLPRLIADVVVEDLGDGGEAFKLLEFYYLPDDFGEALKSLHDALAADGETLSAARILAGLDERYGCAFKESYALTDDTFKQIAARATCGQFEWSGSILRKASEERKDAASFREIVEREFTGIFTTCEFLKFATRIWSSAEAYLHAQLRENFVRHDEDHWSSIGHFKAATGWNEETERQIGDKLQELLGARAFFQMGGTPEQFLDGLPAIEMDGRETRWTLELFASVAEFCVPAVKTLNHGALPDETTTLLVPGDAAGDAVEYMTKVFMERNPKNQFMHSDVEYLDMVTAFLIENGVRRRTSEKLRAKVSAILGSGAN